MKRAKSGERLWGDWRVRVVMPGQKDILWRQHAPAGRGYTAKNIEDVLDQVAEHLEKRFPSVEFRMVELRPNDFRFIYEGRKEMESKNACPVSAQSAKIADELCSKQGHDIIVYQTGMKQSAQGPLMESITICKKCAFGLNEIRGETDRLIEQAVQTGIADRLKAAAAAPLPVLGAKGPVAVPPANSSSEPTAS